jgi:hypothetical protein
MYTNVEQPLTPYHMGAIICRTIGLEPIRFEWSGEGCDTFQFIDDCGSGARNVAPGRYRVTATDANFNRADITVDVTPVYEHAFVVTEYRISHSRTRFSRDGSVEAIGFGTSPGMRFLWTSGVETDVPKLLDVPSGMYTVTAIPSSDDGIVPITIHNCPPARVDVE